ncbi:MAG TPA: HIRAN domain-containing protein [Burkholderiales bacterium]|nr:HIRAN domain-containing protein [Burkholderiales bacterium]
MDPRRLLRAVALGATLASLSVPARAGEEGVRVLVQSSPLAGFRYHEAADLWELLRVGDALELRREADNAHDARAVAVWWRGRKLGYVPRRDNGALAWGLDRGERLSARISRLSEHPNPARRIEFQVYVQ